jgi:hypothetical protein
MRKDVYQKITDQIVQALEQGVRPWHQPWNAAHMEGRVALPLRHNGVAYRGVNVVTLWMQAMASGYTSPVWMTFKQALEFAIGVAFINSPALPQTIFLVDPVPAAVSPMTGYVCHGSHPYLVGQSCFRTTPLSVAEQSSVEALRQELRSQISVLQQNVKALSSAVDALTARLNTEGDKH